MGELRVREGAFYRTRDGRKVGPISFGLHSMRGTQRHWMAPQFDQNLEPSWCEDGSFYSSGRTHPADLVAEWSAGPVRAVTRKEIVCGLYGKVMVNEGPQGGFNSVAMAPTKDPAELRAAIATLTEIADALADATASLAPGETQ